MQRLHRDRWLFASALPLGGLVTALLALVLPALVPVVLLAALTSLVRLGTTILDRFMIASGIAGGSLCGLGLLLSVWPWGFDPVPLGLLGWAALWAFSGLSKRRPELPRVSGADLAFPVVTVAGVYSAWPMLTADGFAGRLALAIIGEDNTRHFAWFRAIGDVQSYIFLASEQVKDSVVPGSDYYPQGWHLVVAVLDAFTGDPSGTRAFDHYVGWTLATHAFLVLTVIWLALLLRRRNSPWHALMISVTAACVVLGSELSGLVVRGYPGESFALSLSLIGIGAVAIASRRQPRRPLREPAWALAATLVGTSFSYYVFLVPLGAFACVWLWSRRRDLRDAPFSVSLAVLFTVAVGWVMPYQGTKAQVANGAFDIPGNPHPVHLALVLLGGIAIGGSALTGLYRRPPWRWLVGGGAAFFVFGAAFAVVGQSGYYAHKVWHVPIAVSVALAVGLLGFVPLRVTDGWTALRATVAVVATGAVAVVAAGLSSWGPGVFTDPVLNTTPLGVWRTELYARTVAADAVVRGLHASTPAREDSLVVDLDPTTAYLANIYLSSLQGTSGSTYHLVYGTALKAPAEQVALAAESADRPLRLLATTPEAAQIAEDVLAARPDGDGPKVGVVTLR